ncbi:SDR family oxidoreductase [soil metagenome]
MAANEQILITGASGFVGEKIARHFAARGHAVLGTFLSTSIAIDGVEMIAVDLADPAAVAQLLAASNPAAIIHCAAQTDTNFCEDFPADARRSIVDATANLARCAPTIPFVTFSTDLVFDGEAAPYPEDGEPKPLSVYGSLKLEAESAVLAHPRGAVLRSALVYGPPGAAKASFLGWMVRALSEWRPLKLFADEWRTPVFVGDLPMAVELLIGRLQTPGTAPGIFHAGGPDRLTRVEMGRMLCEAFDLSGDTIEELRREAIPRGMMRPRDVSLRSDKLKQLGWKQTTFADGLKKCREQWNAQQPS